MQTSTINVTENGLNKGIVFADFDVYKAWQFSMSIVRRDPIFEVETLMGTHQVKEVNRETFHDPRRSQLVSHHKASVSHKLLVVEIISLKRRHLWARIGSKK